MDVAAGLDDAEGAGSKEKLWTRSAAVLHVSPGHRRVMQLPSWFIHTPTLPRRVLIPFRMRLVSHAFACPLVLLHDLTDDR